MLRQAALNMFADAAMVACRLVAIQLYAAVKVSSHTLHTELRSAPTMPCHAPSEASPIDLQFLLLHIAVLSVP